MQRPCLAPGPAGPERGAPPFGDASSGIAASFPSRNRCRPSPCGRLSRPRSTTTAPPHPGPIGGRRAQPHPHHWKRRAGQDPGQFPCSVWFARRSRSPTMPLRHRCEYAADLPRSLPGSSCPPPREFPAAHRDGCGLPQPRSTRFELVPHQEGVTRRFLTHSSPSRSPNPDRLAVPARPGFVRAAPTLPGVTRIRLPPAPPPCCDRVSGEVGVGPGRGTGLVTSPFPRSALRTGRATLTASGAPRTPLGTARFTPSRPSPMVSECCIRASDSGPPSPAAGRTA